MLWHGLGMGSSPIVGMGWLGMGWIHGSSQGGAQWCGLIHLGHMHCQVTIMRKDMALALRIRNINRGHDPSKPGTMPK